MPNLLLIESSSKNCSVAVCNEQNILSIREETSDQFVHSEKLHVFIKECMLESKLFYRELSAICVSKGPGSYTGLRIGVSAAKGLCYPLNLPLIAIDSLTVIAAQLFGKVEEGVIIPMMDARRLEVYQAVFNLKGEMIKPIKAIILDENSYSEWLQKGSVYFVGDACEKAMEIIQHENAIFCNQLKYPSTKDMMPLCLDKFNAKTFEDVAYFEPFYLKDFVAGKPKKML